MDLKTCYQQMRGDYEAVMGRLRQEDRVRRFLLLFPKDENYQLLGEGLERKDWEQAFRAAHSLKGVALNLGLSELAQSSSELTELLRAGAPTEDPGPLYQRVREDYERTVGAIGTLAEEG